MKKICLLSSVFCFLSLILITACGEDKVTITKTVTPSDLLSDKPWKFEKFVIADSLFALDQCDKTVSWTFRGDLKDILVSRDLFHYKFLRLDTIAIDSAKKPFRYITEVINDTTFCDWSNEGKYPKYVHHEWALSQDAKTLKLKKIWPKEAKDSTLNIKELTDKKLVLSSTSGLPFEITLTNQ
jgi:hypothetical protein